MAGRVLAIGECMVELAPIGADSYRRGFAGDTYNFAWYARRLLPPEWQVGYCSWIGSDAVSEQMRSAMEEAGIGTAAIRRSATRTVGLYMIELRDGERSFIYWRDRSAARLLASDPDWLRAQIVGADLVLFSGITLAIVEAQDRPALLAALGEARRRGTRVAFDSNIRRRLWASEAEMRDALAAAAAVADVVLPSFDDESAAWGDADPAATIARFRAAGAGSVVVKNGSAAILAWDAEEGEIEFSPPPVRAVDTTAAGDSFNAGYLAARLAGQPLAEAVAAGSRLAARVIQHPGALVPAALS
jgi:2-dehydro-3-deoxygluconokinase